MGAPALFMPSEFPRIGMVRKQKNPAELSRAFDIICLVVAVATRSNRAPHAWSINPYVRRLLPNSTSRASSSRSSIGRLSSSPTFIARWTAGRDPTPSYQRLRVG